VIRLVLIRHGESRWNRENRFTGWTDIDLTEQGVSQASRAGRLLKSKGFVFDLAFSSILKRSKRTLAIILDEMRQRPEVRRSWRLNERHYGALQGLSKNETAAKYGEAKVATWRRSYDVRPPALKKSDPRYPGNMRLFQGIPGIDLPTTECLKDVVARVLPYWRSQIAPALKEGRMVIISAHGNSLRSLVKHIDRMSKKDIMALDIPVGTPLVYELDKRLKPIRHYYLGDQRAIKQAIDAVKAQGKAR
jgi:2,3-bisphosphoglycerate-dependent phosphoglycerate mutase